MGDTLPRVGSAVIVRDEANRILLGKRNKDPQRGSWILPGGKIQAFESIAQAAAREDVELFYQQMVQDIWDCSQCFSCLRCPRGNNPGGIVTLMREVAVNNGLDSAKQALRGYTRIIYKIMSTGTQVSPDMLRADAFPDWGPSVVEVSDNLDLWRRALPPETLHTTTTGWDISPKTLIELYIIWHKTGALDVIAELDPSLHGLLEELMEDQLDEAGYEVD